VVVHLHRIFLPFIALVVIVVAGRQSPGSESREGETGSPGEKLGAVHTIRSLEGTDRVRWQRLWDGYLAFYRAELSEETTRSTFERLTGSRDDMFGLLAVGERDEAIGLPT
jgi:hypothetical protein